MVGIIVTVVACLVVTGVVTVLALSMKKKTQGQAALDYRAVVEKISGADDALGRAFNGVQALTPLNESHELIDKINSLKAQFEVEREKLQSLERKLNELQTQVDTEETNHNELKRSKDDSLRLADEVLLRTEETSAEFTRLKNELEQSKVQMDLLSDEVELTAEQSQAINEITEAVTAAGTLLAAVTKNYEDSSSRFTRLQTQYVELEKEYRKLIERELEGTI